MDKGLNILLYYHTCKFHIIHTIYLYRTCTIPSYIEAYRINCKWFFCGKSRNPSILKGWKRLLRNYIGAHTSSLWWPSSLCAVVQSSALFVMSMNADLWPLRWPLQPPWKFTGGSESPCASIDTVLMETPTPPSQLNQTPLGKSVCLCVHVCVCLSQSDTNQNKQKPGHDASMRFRVYFKSDSVWEYCVDM